MAGPALSTRTSVSIPAGVFSLDEFLVRRDDLLRILIRHQRMLTFAVALAGITVFAPGAGESSGDAVDFERGPRPGALEDRIARLAGQPRRADFVSSEIPFHRTAEIDQLCFSAGEGGSTSSYMPGIWMWPLASFSFESSSTSPNTALGAAPPYNAGMQIARRAARFDLGIDQAAQADAQRRNAFGVELGIGNQRDIGLQLGRILGDILRHRFAADFLFAFDQKLEVDRQRAVDRAQRLHGFDVHVHLAFVVGRAARVEIAVAHGGLEGRRDPQSSGSGGCTS